MRMQVILDYPFACPGSAPLWGGKKGEFRDWASSYLSVRIQLFLSIIVIFICIIIPKPNSSEVSNKDIKQHIKSHRPRKKSEFQMGFEPTTLRVSNSSEQNK